MTILTPPTSATAAPVRRRINFRFSADGRSAACLAAGEDGLLRPECWDLGGGQASPRPIRPDAAVETQATQLLPLDDGTVVLSRADGQLAWHRHADTRALGRRRIPGPLRLLAGARPQDLALVIGVPADRPAGLHRIHADESVTENQVQLPGAVWGGFWLDADRTRLGTTLVHGGAVQPIAVSVASGAWTPLLPVARGSQLRLVDCAPASGLLLLRQFRDGEHRLGWGRLEQPEAGGSARFPDLLAELGSPVFPLAIDPAGRRVALEVASGAGSRLLLWTPEEDRLAEVELPGGRLGGRGHWNEHGLRLPFDNGMTALGLITVTDEPSGNSVRSHGDLALAGRAPRLAHFEGPEGELEAVVWGEPDLRRARQLVLSLHGGPASAWSLGYNQLHQELAEAGTTVIGLNQRGSTGYGDAHRRAIQDAWGGPDLADVRAVLRQLHHERAEAGRPRPALLGASYGGYLALLAAAAESTAVRRTVVLAPFLSGRRLYRQAGPQIRALIERSGGLAELHDELGPRDALAWGHRLRGPLLIAHGAQDTVIPVDQSRALHRELVRHDRAVDYLELPDAGHELFTGTGGAATRRRVVTFLSEPERR